MAAPMPPEPRDRWSRIFTIAWSCVGLGLLLYAAGWVLGKLAPALVPFFLALVLVLVFKAPVAALERRGLKRGAAVGVCYLVAFIVVGVSLGFLIPALVEQVREFVEAFPGYYDQAVKLLFDLQDKYRALAMPQWVQDVLMNIQDTIARRSAEWSAALARQIFTVGGSAVTFLATALLSLVVGFWILKDLPAITREILVLAGPRGRDEVKVVSATVSRVLGGYLKGQVIIALVTGTIVAVGLAIIRVPYSLVIGLLAVPLNFIPWIGPTILAVIAGISAAFVSPMHIIGAVAVCVGAQQMTEYFVQPRVMSEQVDLHPLLVIFSLLAGSTLFGFPGLLLGIPVAGVAKGLFVYYFERYTNADLASEDGALFRSYLDEDGDAEPGKPAADGSSSQSDEPEEDG